MVLGACDGHPAGALDSGGDSERGGGGSRSGRDPGVDAVAVDGECKLAVAFEGRSEVDARGVCLLLLIRV
eukprot:scaffold138155_cov27-Tisochrysis_lutea.AAC.3